MLNFQTMVSDLTGMEIANASLLDEATAAAEAMTFCQRVSKSKSNVFFVSQDCFPQTIDVVRTRAEPIGIEVVVGDHRTALDRSTASACCCNTRRWMAKFMITRDTVAKAHAKNALVVVAADLLALTLLTPPGEFGADVAVGSAQRFGVPLGYGAGVRQRVQTLNLFLADIYGPQKVLKDGIVPAELVLGNANYRTEMQGLVLPHGTYVHINGTDLVRDGEGRFRVLEDNGRSPSGVSYVVENRHLMLRAFSDLMKAVPVRPGLRLWPPAAREAVGGRARGRAWIRRSCCCRPACSTPPISSTCSSPARWACRWSKAATWRSRTTGCSCAPSPGRCRST